MGGTHAYSYIGWPNLGARGKKMRLSTLRTLALRIWPTMVHSSMNAR